MRALSSKNAAALVVLGAFLTGGPATVGRGGDTDGGQTPSLPLEEAPYDEPGTPARPLMGARPAAPVAFNSFASIQVNVDAAGANIPGDAANEPSIAVDPNHPNRMAIGWRQFDTVASDFRQAGWAYSRDGGRTWTFPGPLDPGAYRSDPVLDYDSAGNFYFMSLQAYYTNDMFKSSDQGMTWEPPTLAWGGDKEWIAVDRTGGMGDGHIYSSWDIYTLFPGLFTRSTDGGASFEEPLWLPGTPSFGTLAVGTDGTLYIAGHNADIGYSTFSVTQSTNARDASQPPDFTTAGVDLGGTLVYPTGVPTPNPIGLLGQVYVDVDPVHGLVLVLCSVDPPGPDPLDVHFTRSADGGVTWSPPIRINTDPPDPGSWQWFGTMSVAPNGRIDVIWNDTRGSQGFTVSQLYYAYSLDGGSTWAAEVPVSPPWDSWIGWPGTRRPNRKIGDYYDMVSDDVGVHVAWAATFNGEEDVYYMRIGDYDCNRNGIPDTQDIAGGTSQDRDGNGIPDECEASGDPLADAGPDQTLECQGDLRAIAVLDGSNSTDSDSSPGTNDDIVSFEWSEGGSPVASGETVSLPLDVGAHEVTLTVADKAGATDTDGVVITVQDTTPPTIGCPPGPTIECEAAGQAYVGLPLASASDGCHGNASIANDRTPNGADASGIFPLGATKVTFTATDGSGNAALCDTTVTVADTTPPVVTVDAAPRTLWPPNHNLVSVHSGAVVLETCDPSPSLVLHSVVSSEPDDAPGGGDGSTVNDIQDASSGTADFDILLRAEREGEGPGRTYTIRYLATDASGNVGEGTDRVDVPHDQGGVGDPISPVTNGATSTVVRWEPVHQVRYYDVIRGNLDRIRVDGSDLDLGAAVCIRKDSTDPSTVGHEDAETPESGEVFFYLVQFSDGIQGRSYGEPSAPKARRPGAFHLRTGW